jgi:hypothetical protein
MLSMPRTPAVGHRMVSVATALVFGGAFGLYQMTSLVLGPVGTRQLHVSLDIPALDRNDGPDPVASGSVVLGSLAPVIRPVPALARHATPVHRIVLHPASVAPTNAATPVATLTPLPPLPAPAPRPSVRPRPSVPPLPPAPGDDEGD